MKNKRTNTGILFRRALAGGALIWAFHGAVSLWDFKRSHDRLEEQHAGARTCEEKRKRYELCTGVEKQDLEQREERMQRMGEEKLWSLTYAFNTFMIGGPVWVGCNVMRRRRMDKKQKRHNSWRKFGEKDRIGL